MKGKNFQIDGGVTGLQTGPQEGVCKLLIPRGSFLRGHPTPRSFGKRGCKLLKTKDGSRKKRGKRLQTIAGSKVRGGTAGEVGAGCLRYHAQTYYNSGRLSMVNCRLRVLKGMRTPFRSRVS